MKRTPINLFLLISLFSALMFYALFAGLITAATGAPFLAVFGVFVLGSLASNKTYRGALMAQGLNITELAAKLGAYYRANRDILISETLLGFDPSDSFEVWDDISDEIPMPNLSITDLIKPADDVNFQPSVNALNFGARIGKVRNWKVDLLIQPRILEKTWLGQYKQKGSNTQDLIFEAYIFRYIIAKIQENMRLQAVYRGVYNAAGATPLDVMDGLLTLVAAEITGGNINPVVTGVITQVNVVDKLLQTYDALGEAYKAVPTEMPVNSTIFDWYCRKFAPILNQSLVATDVAAGLTVPRMNAMPLQGTNCTLKREPGLGVSQRLICTSKENKVYLTDSMSDENSIKVQVFERSLKLMLDAKSGVQFKEINSRALAVNDQV